MLAELVSFTKGCYPGQELVERMDAKQSSSPFEIIRMAGDLDVGAEVIVDGVAVGVVTSSDGGQCWFEPVVAEIPDASSVGASVRSGGGGRRLFARDLRLCIRP